MGGEDEIIVREERRRLLGGRRGGILLGGGRERRVTRSVTWKTTWTAARAHTNVSNSPPTPPHPHPTPSAHTNVSNLPHPRVKSTLPPRDSVGLHPSGPSPTLTYGTPNPPFRFPMRVVHHSPVSGEAAVVPSRARRRGQHVGLEA